MQRRKYCVYGPYRRGRKWIVRLRAWESGRPVETAELFDTEDEARQHRADLEETLNEKHAYRRAAELQALADQAFAEAQALDNRNRTVNEAIDGFELYLRQKGNRSKSITTAMYRLRGLLRDVLNQSVMVVNARRAKTLYESRVAAGVSAATHRAELSAARHMWRWLNKEGWTVLDPWADVEGIGRVNRGKAQLRAHEARRLDQIALLEAVGNPDNGRWMESRARGALAVLCALYFGLRATEVISLEGRDVVGGEVMVEKGKTAKSTRRLAVPSELRELLEKRALAVGMHGRLFAHSRGWLLNHTKRLCQLAGVPMVCSHSLRGLHATLATEAGATGEMIAAQLGHVSPTITQAHYTDPAAVQVARQRKAFEVLQGGLRTPQGPPGEEKKGSTVSAKTVDRDSSVPQSRFEKR